MLPTSHLNSMYTSIFLLKFMFYSMEGCFYINWPRDEATASECDRWSTEGVSHPAALDKLLPSFQGCLRVNLNRSLNNLVVLRVVHLCQVSSSDCNCAVGFWCSWEPETYIGHNVARLLPPSSTSYRQQLKFAQADPSGSFYLTASKQALMGPPAAPS